MERITAVQALKITSRITKQKKEQQVLLSMKIYLGTELLVVSAGGLSAQGQLPNRQSLIIAPQRVGKGKLTTRN